MSTITFLLGGARSGKSAFAEQLAQETGGKSVLFVATAEPGDAEMQARIERHQQARPVGWRTLEASQSVAAALREAFAGERAIVVDCLTVLTSNILLSFDDPIGPDAVEAVYREVSALLDVLRDLDAHTILVSNEVGMGLVPPYPLGRAYRDVLGIVNQRIAQAADEVYFLVAGIPMTVKPGSRYATRNT